MAETTADKIRNVLLTIKTATLSMSEEEVKDLHDTITQFMPLVRQEAANREQQAQFLVLPTPGCP